MTTQTETGPIVCTLTPGDFKDRLAWIAALNRDALREKRRNDLRLDLTYAPQAAARVREMVEREQGCCAFLSFELSEHADAVRLSIAAPEAARDAADVLFEHFQSVNPAAAACGCGGTRQESERSDPECYPEHYCR